jgi:hypothetical protein
LHCSKCTIAGRFLLGGFLALMNASQTETKEIVGRESEGGSTNQAMLHGLSTQLSLDLSRPIPNGRNVVRVLRGPIAKERSRAIGDYHGDRSRITDLRDDQSGLTIPSHDGGLGGVAILASTGWSRSISRDDLPQMRYCELVSCEE